MLAEPRPYAARRDGDIVELSFALDPDLEVLPDHFPRYPMLPGVVQLGWAVRGAQRSFGFAGEPRRVTALKFMQPIRPGQQLVLRLEKLAAQDVAFSYTADGAAASSGRLRFA